MTTEKRKANAPKDFLVIENTHEPIISKENFQIVQQLIEERKHKRPYAKKHLFSNIAYCADCGKRMHFKANRKGYIYGSYNKHGHTQCTSHLIREVPLIEILTNEVKSMFTVLSTDTFQKDVDAKIEKFIKRDQKKLKQLTREIERLKQDNVKALRMKVRDEIQEDEYSLLTEDNNLKMTRFLKEKEGIEQNMLHQKQKIDFSQLINQINQFIDNPVLDEEILHKLIERIEIKEDGSPRIHYRFSAPYMSSIFL